jgi:predicted permease
MPTLREFVQRLLGVMRRSRTDADLEDELRLHVELAADREATSGRPAPDARRQAQLTAGSVAHAMDALRDQRGLPWLDAIRADLVFGWRQIARHGIASAATVLSLGLAMGAALAAFRLVDAVLLRPLPVADPSRLFVISRTYAESLQRQEERDDFDYPTYRLYAARVAGQADVVLMGMAVRREIAFDAHEPETAVQQFVSGNAFATLGIRPTLGRALGESDDTTPGGHPVAVITDEYWQRRFGGEPSVIGRTFRMAGRVYSIVGVASLGFTGTEPGLVTDFFVPSMMNPDALNAKGWSWFRIWVRPRAGVSVDRVMAALREGFRLDQIERAKELPPDAPKARVEGFWAEHLDLLAAASGASGVQKTFRQPLWILAALATLLVLLACANVANLLLARAASRTIELALRRAIGAARRRLVQMLLVESALLALLAAAVGAAFAAWAAPFVVSMLAPAERPIRLVLDLDLRTAVIAITLVVAVTMLFGLAPALRASKTPLLDALKEARGQRGQRRIGETLVAAQAACCVFLLFGASLFVGTLDRLRNRPLGFSPDHLWSLDVESPRPLVPEEWSQLVASISALPRVKSAALAGWAPLTGNRWRSSIAVTGRGPQDLSPQWVSVAPGYLATMQMRLVGGRDFRAGDRPPGEKADRSTPGVAIVNETFARVYFDGRSPVGQRVTVRSSNAKMEIVGMVADAVYYSVREASYPSVYVPIEPREGATLLVRTDGISLDLPQVLRGEIPRLGPGLQVREVVRFESIVTQQMIRERLLAALSTFFAVLALVLAIIGIYGVLNYAVTRQQREIGLRMALGARPGHVVTLIVTRLTRMVVVGAAAGIGLGVALGRVVRTLLYQMEPTDLSTLAPPIVALAMAAALAVWIPARRAVRTDPARTMRTEGS